MFLEVYFRSKKNNIRKHIFNDIKIIFWYVYFRSDSEGWQKKLSPKLYIRIFDLIVSIFSLSLFWSVLFFIKEGWFRINFWFEITSLNCFLFSLIYNSDFYTYLVFLLCLCVVLSYLYYLFIVLVQCFAFSSYCDVLWFKFMD